MRAFVLIAALALSACGFRPEKIFASYVNLEVREVGRSLYCQTESEQPQARLLPDLQAVLDWQSARGLSLAAPEALAQAPYAIVEMGVRPTGGYGLAVARSAVLRGELLILHATFLSPSGGGMVTQAQTSPCVLVQLPPGRYSRVEVQDQTGEIRATGTRPEGPAS